MFARHTVANASNGEKHHWHQRSLASMTYAGDNMCISGVHGHCCRHFRHGTAVGDMSNAFLHA